MNSSDMMSPSDMLNHSSQWMDSGMVIWTVFAVVGMVLLVLVFRKWSKK